jgi:hypothetical protein
MCCPRLPSPFSLLCGRVLAELRALLSNNTYQPVSKDIEFLDNATYTRLRGLPVSDPFFGHVSASALSLSS